jgi:hypothetical protein
MSLVIWVMSHVMSQMGISISCGVWDLVELFV